MDRSDEKLEQQYQLFDDLYTNEELYGDNSNKNTKINDFIGKFKSIGNHSLKNALKKINSLSPVEDIFIALSYPELLKNKNIDFTSKNILRYCEAKFRKDNKFYDEEIAQKLLKIVQTEKNQEIKDKAATFLFRLIHCNNTDYFDDKKTRQKNYSNEFKNKVYKAFEAAGYKTRFYNLTTEEQFANGCWYWAPRNLVKNLLPKQQYPSFTVQGREIKNNWLQVKDENININDLILNGCNNLKEHLLYTSNGFIKINVFKINNQDIKIQYTYPNNYKSRVLYHLYSSDDDRYIQEVYSSPQNNSKQRVIDIIDNKGPFAYGGEYSRSGPGGHVVICCGYALSGNVLFFADSAPSGYTSFMSYNQFKKRAYEDRNIPFSLTGYYYNKKPQNALQVMTDLNMIAAKRKNSKNLVSYEYK